MQTSLLRAFAAAGAALFLLSACRGTSAGGFAPPSTLQQKVQFAYSWPHELKPTPVPTIPPSQLPVLTDTDPSTGGVFLGEVCDGTIRVQCPTYSTYFRRTIALGVIFADWNVDMAYFIKSQGLDYWKRLGIVPEITWQPHGISYADINNGLWDSYLKLSAHEMLAYGAPIFVRPFHEFNNPGEPWSLPKQGANAAADAAFIAAWQRMVTIFRAAGASNVKFVWCYSAGELTWAKNNTWDLPASAYPGDDYVDWISFDTYQRGNRLTGKPWLDFDQISFASYKTAVTISPAKPVSISEIGATEWGDGGRRKAQWLEQMLFELSLPAPYNRYPNLRLISYYDSDAHGWAYKLRTSRRSYYTWTNAIRSRSSAGTLNFRSNPAALLNVTVP
ncbi:MAG TPA: glycosyl hydrolase [Candidatus Baltobacteraceae bacterium]|nr:glycosyl hydrolase [Candidatus Baltobacteraceae bacterium]